MAFSSAACQIPTLLLIPSRKQSLHTHHNSQLQLHPRTAFQKCFSQRSSSSEPPQKENEVFEFERLFSNLNQATLKREPGSSITFLSFFKFSALPIQWFFSALVLHFKLHLILCDFSFSCIYQEVSRVQFSWLRAPRYALSYQWIRKYFVE